MTVEVDTNSLEHHLDGIKKLAESNSSSRFNSYPQYYADFKKVLALLGLYVSFVDGRHVIVRK